jgi:hypothetical protein
MALILTSKGEMEESLLEKREGVIDNEVEFTTWTEHWYQGELVKRSAHVTIKQSAAVARGESGGW